VRRVWAFALVLASTVSLAACATQTPEVPVISYDEAKTELVTLLDETAETLGGEWTIERFEGEGWCNYAEGVDGRNFAAWRSAPPSDDPQASAEQVRAEWESRGFEVETNVVPDPDIYQVNARGSGGFHVHLSSGAAKMILSGESECIRAD
jgi:hypothetical protein